MLDREKNWEQDDLLKSDKDNGEDNGNDWPPEDIEKEKEDD